MFSELLSIRVLGTCPRANVSAEHVFGICCLFYKIVLGNSLVVQWLGLHAFTAVARVQSLFGELRSHKLRSAVKKIKF